HHLEGWLVLEARSVSYGKAASYLPVIDLLRDYFRIGDRDTQRDIRDKVTGKILTLDRALEPILPVAGPPGRAGRGSRVAGPRRSRAPAADARCCHAPRSSRDAGAATAHGLRGPALDRHRNPSVPRWPHREPAHGAAAPPRRLPARVPSCLGEQ